MDPHLINKIADQLKRNLPADAAHEKLSPVRFSNYREVSNSPKEAAVLALIYPKNAEAHIVFMKRTSKYPDDKHAGQISFPGGKKEDDDIGLVDCAMRETFEEIGINGNQYDIIGPLNKLYVYVSNFLVYPYLAIASQELIFNPEEDEVERIIEYPLKHFLYFKNLNKKDLRIREGVMKNVPYFDLNGDVLWGATSMIMSELIAILEEMDVQENQLKYS